MPSGWMHATLDLITFGEPHLDLHQKKDASWRRLGTAHRQENHEWYAAFDEGVWTFADPFPSWLDDTVQAIVATHDDEAAERYMAETCHEFWDRWWDDVSMRERKCIEA